MTQIYSLHSFLGKLYRESIERRKGMNEETLFALLPWQCQPFFTTNMLQQSLPKKYQWIARYCHHCIVPFPKKKVRYYHGRKVGTQITFESVCVAQ